MRRTLLAALTATLLATAPAAWAHGEWSKWVDCTQHWWDAGKKVTAKTRGSGLVTAYTPNAVDSVFSPAADATARANDPTAQAATVGGGTTLNWEYGKGYCWW